MCPSQVGSGMSNNNLGPGCVPASILWFCMGTGPSFEILDGCSPGLGSTFLGLSGPVKNSTDTRLQVTFSYFIHMRLFNA